MEIADMHKALAKVQVDLKVGKNHKNQHMGFSYRSAEDILCQVKPLLLEAGLTLTLRDEIVQIGDRFYIKATCYLNGNEVGSAFAREGAESRGLDVAQVTGLSSSYARKYALQAVFLLDDGDADVDSMPPQKDPVPQAVKKAAKKAAAKKAEKDAPDAWRAWQIPFKKSEHFGRTLGEMADKKEVKVLEDILDYKRSNYDPDSQYADKNMREINWLVQAVSACDDDDIPF
jgi:hypothetical protein